MPSSTRYWFVPVVAVLVLILQVHRSDGFSLCKTTAKTEDCLYGKAKDFCGNMVCAKGPGERCGGPYGRCGEGMHCKCEVCSGCSVDTFDCHIGRPTCF